MSNVLNSSNQSRNARAAASMHSGPSSLAQPLVPESPMAGREVGGSRWPHPLSMANRPWKGVVLAYNDPRAWEGSLRFPGSAKELKQAEIDAHVSWCVDGGLLVGPKDASVPVLWDFGTHHKVYWTDPASLVEYPEDVRRWETALRAEETLRSERACTFVVMEPASVLADVDGDACAFAPSRMR